MVALPQNEEYICKTARTVEGAKELVEVTVKIPKRLLDVLEQEDYFGWNKQDFFVAAIKRCISCEVEDISYAESGRLEKKYGFDPGLVEFSTKKTLVYP